MELSECAFYDTNAEQTVQTMKVDRLVGNHHVRILLDSGSTHNFVDSRLVKWLGWQLHDSKPFDVMIVDGGKVRRQGYYRNGSLELGGYKCALDLCSLPLGVCGVVLEVQWLSSVSPML